MDYLINIAVAARSYWMIAVVIYAIYLFVPSTLLVNENVDLKKFLPKVALFIFVAGTLIGLTSPSNTYKLTTDYNKSQDLRSIEQLDDSAAMQPLVIQDISRQPSTAEDRAESAIDIRERVEVDLD